MIPPSGAMLTGPGVVAMLQSARGSRAQGFAIRIEVQDARKLGDLALILYDEHQDIGGATTLRRSSALFSADASAPEGVVWRHLHETWIKNT
jgi:hypothetical protein